MTTPQAADLHADDDARALEQQISALVERIRTAQRRVEALNVEMQKSREELRPLLEKLGANWTDDNGYARLVREGIQRYYDVDALDKLILSDPLRYGWLSDYRSERILSERIHIR